MNKNKFSGSGLFQNSVMVHYITKFSGWVYAVFLSGVFGWFLTAYDYFSEKFQSAWLVKKIRKLSEYRAITTVKKWKRFVAQTYESSVFLNQIRGTSNIILTARVNNFGLFFFSYGLFLVMIQLIKKYAVHMETSVPHALYIGLICVVVGFFMMFSNKNVANAICGSRLIYVFLFEFLALDVVNIAKAARLEVRKGFNIPFLLGVALGLISVFIDPLFIIRAIGMLALLSLVLSSPESGIIVTFLALPFMSTMHLAAWLCLIFISYFLKLLCGRRVFRLHMVDFSVLAFMFFIFFGGVLTIDASSFAKMLLMICFMLSYFVIKNIISSPSLVRRCLMALVFSSAVVAAYGIYQNYFGELSTIWQDTSVFAEIRGRVVSVFENPNVLGEYLILLFPLTLAMMATAKKANERFAFFVCAALNCVCLIFTWSRGAWIGFALATVLFLCVSSKYFFTAGLLSIPVIGTFVVFKVDSSIIRRITSFGDSSTSYRLGIWEGTLRMLEDVGFFGIGIGEGAFTKLYPVYALAGIETAPHSHNLYLQIAVETGYISLLAFFVFVLIFTQCSFGFCKRAMKRDNKLICIGIFCGVLAFLIQGMTDYVWYNNRIFLLFWMIVGLGIAHIYTSKGTDEESLDYYA